jgi:hypothetical protein
LSGNFVGIMFNLIVEVNNSTLQLEF